MSNLTEPQSLLTEVVKQTSGELTSVEVMAYVEALSRSASTLAAAEKDYSVKPSAINSTLSVSFVYRCCFSVNIWSFAWNALLLWTSLRKQPVLQSVEDLLCTSEEKEKSSNAKYIAEYCSIYFFPPRLLAEGQSKKRWWSCWNHTKLKACHTWHVILYTSDWERILVKQKLVQAVNNLVEKDELVAWSRMKEERREHTATKLLHVVEESALSLGSNFKTPAEINIKATEMGERSVCRLQ